MELNLEGILKRAYGENARFIEGQKEAIQSVLDSEKTLIVQKTGWGKSLIYFICSKILKKEKKGLTIVISPLLVLMENQKDASTKFNIRSSTLNGNLSKIDIKIVIENMKKGELDLVFITPETLFNEQIQEALKNIKIALLVIDEVHCISDWGHDFRLKYSKLNKVVKKLPNYVKFLGTTATANNRVVKDLEKQLGGNVKVFRGDLERKSLYINVIKLKDKADRYTWILKNIDKLDGTGIIYCLTKRDCKNLAEFLNQNGVKAKHYYSGDNNEEYNTETIKLFSNNKIKVIVSTIKLGMGYDKGDVSFVIHFQIPKNIVSYYQQIGRAGRKIDKAYAILMAGVEDENIHNNFIEGAFPDKQQCDSIISLLEHSNGINKNTFISKLNFRARQIEKALMFLENEEAIYLDKKDKKYYLTTKNYNYNGEHYEEIKKIKIEEFKKMKQLVDTDGCYNKFLLNSLNNYKEDDCGRCGNCNDNNFFKTLTYKFQEKKKAVDFLNNRVIIIKPRKQWVLTKITKNTFIEKRLESGIALCKYGDFVYGKMVKEDKYSNNKFRKELVEKSANSLRELINDNNIEYLTYVPSLRSDIVEKFAIDLSNRLNLKLVRTLSKTKAEPQKSMENSSHQSYNALKSFSVAEFIDRPQKIILVDDIVDSRWTITVCGNLLLEAGIEKVFPFALADSSNEGG